MARPQLPPFIQFGNAFQHSGTGEMHVPRSDGELGLVPTGFTFERVTQSLPAVTDMQGPRIAGVQLTPWAFATQRTAEVVLDYLKPMVPSDVQLTLQTADANTQFPLSADMLQIRAKRGQYKARICAGLLASDIGRSTATVDGQIRQFPAPCYEHAVGELLLELERLELERLANPPEFAIGNESVAKDKYIIRAMPKSLMEYAAFCSRAA